MRVGSTVGEFVLRSKSDQMRPCKFCHEILQRPSRVEGVDVERGYEYIPYLANRIVIIDSVRNELDWVGRRELLEKVEWCVGKAAKGPPRGQEMAEVRMIQSRSLLDSESHSKSSTTIHPLNLNERIGPYCHVIYSHQTITVVVFLVMGKEEGSMGRVLSCKAAWAAWRGTRQGR